MAFCVNCGQKMEDDCKFCPTCGTEIPRAEKTENTQQTYTQPKSGNDFSQILETPDTTNEFDRNDITENKVMAVLSYLGILVLIPIFAAKNSKFARFHANQGLLVFLSSIAFNLVISIIKKVFYYIAYPVYWIVNVFSPIIGLLFVVLAIIGIVNAANGKAKELPIIGKLRIFK
ncbi:MAG: zinc-ribbon domain-containing protein [Clostridia bacterium]|nr:zinc-ribbon domain-containing protein [Clostridia bacterium]